ncbi:transposase [Aeoliella sp. SH292]|uniref:transposase n=1 Tax=Aeoliella sp. SH292 TaxID=3454464 RepID=UPI003F97A168
MIHGYHVIMPAYGFWLPNDPRGSWSEIVRKWEFLKFGRGARSLERRTFDELSFEEIRLRDEAQRSLRYPAVSLTGAQALSVGNAFGQLVAKSGYTVWACSVLPEHVHLVLARHHYKVEQMVNLLKGAATSRLTEDGIHPLAAYRGEHARPPRMWAEHEWKVYLDSEEQIETAIRYVEENPAKEGKRKQSWSFVTPFAGISRGGWQTYH